MVWVILTEGGRIRLTGAIVPCAAGEIIIRVSIAIEIITTRGPWIQLTVGVRILLTGEQIFPGTICITDVVIRVKIFAAINATVEPDYHPQVRQVVHGG